MGQTPTTGGTVIFRAEGGPDWIDPGLTYYTFGYMITYATNRTLYSSIPGQPEHPVPDLAEGDPMISGDSKMITVTLKSGVRFSPPVNREVTSSDIKYAIERAFTENVPSGYVFTYFSDLVGAPSEPGPFADIQGIETPDERTIVFRLERPTAATFAAALQMPITVPVPKEYAEPFDQENPSTYDSHVVFTGPYMIRNDSEGNLVGLADDIEIVRNPNWDPVTDYRPAYLDEIRIRSGGDINRMATRTLAGSHLMCCDVSPTEVVKQFRSTYPDQIGSAPGHGTRWVAFNTTVRPLTNLNVRKALAAIMNRKALRATRGGRILGRIAKHFLPPGVPGFEESGGYGGFGLDYMDHPNGDSTIARKYMLRARRDGVRITRRGQYAGNTTLLMIGADFGPAIPVARRVKRQVERLGFEVDLRLKPFDEMFLRWCGIRDAKVAICPNVGWFFDFFDPQSLLEPTFSGDAIDRQGFSTNWSLLDDSEIDAAMDAAAILPPGPDRTEAWADINRRITRQAPGVPWVWDSNYQVESSDVHGVMNPYFSLWDLSFTYVKT